jgi:hypothetical protein
MKSITITAYQVVDGVRKTAIEFAVEGKIRKFDAAVAPSVEEMIRWMKMRRECGRKTGFSMKHDLHFQIDREGIQLCDTASLRMNAWADMKPPVNNPKSRALFRQRLRSVFEYAYAEVRVYDDFDKWITATREEDVIPARANG